jgi:hypothetical protein
MPPVTMDMLDGYVPLAYQAYRLKMTFNSGYFARINQSKSVQYCQELHQKIQAGSSNLTPFMSCTATPGMWSVRTSPRSCVVAWVSTSLVSQHCGTMPFGMCLNSTGSNNRMTARTWRVCTPEEVSVEHTRRAIRVLLVALAIDELAAFWLPRQGDEEAARIAFQEQDG